MNRQQQRMGIIVLVWVFVLGMFTVTQALAQNASSFHRHFMPTLILQHTAKIPDPGSKARRIALERYAFVKRLKPIFGFVPPRLTGNVHCDVLFPIGRSDRVYLFFYYGYSKSPTGGAIICYQHKPGKDQKDVQDQKVYQVNLEGIHRPTHKAKRIKSLLDYISTNGETYSDGGHTVYNNFAIMGGISPRMRKDLAMKREYVAYFYNPFNDDLSVTRLSEYEYGSLPETAGEAFRVNEDPVTKAKITPDEFFAKYGLPLENGELLGK